jgi:[ribosomal protein S5]-alanine N-acetyltransferase
MINVSTSRMIIRNFTPDDWQDLQQIVIDKETSEYAYTDYPFPVGEKEVKEITGYFSNSDNFLAAFEKAEKKVIGYIAVNSEKPSEYNLGYCFLTAYQDKGYATESCIAVINHVFNGNKAEKFVTGTALGNEPSCKLLTKLGFRKAGESTTSFRKDKDGKPIEFTGAFFELTKAMWKKIQH